MAIAQLNFDNDNNSGDGVNSVDIQVGLSFINASLASSNLDAALAKIDQNTKKNLKKMNNNNEEKEENKVISLTYDDFLNNIDQIWCTALSLVDEDFESLTDDEEMTELFHTAIYRTFLSPTMYSEPGSSDGGAYYGLDNVLHSSKDDAKNLGDCQDQETQKDSDHKDGDSDSDDDDVESSFVDKWRETSQGFASQHFSDMSLWDTFRSMNPWLLFAQKPIALGVLRSMAAMTEQQGAFPHWPIGSHDSGCMYGTHGATLALDALLVETPDDNSNDTCGTWSHSAQTIGVAIQAQLLAMATTSNTPNGRNDLDHYLTNGFVSIESTDKSATYTVAYAYDDYVLGSISTILESLNLSIISHNDTLNAMERSSNYKNVWSPQNLYFCPRSNNGTNGNGNLICPKDPASPLIDKQWYTEGDAYHYAYYVFQDIPGLIENLYDSPQQFDDTLLNMFTKSLDHPFGEPVPNEYYWAGNEHDILYPWFFNFGPNCTHTQEWTRKLTHLHYNTSPHGIPGNDDYGAMSSWLVWASIGIHPLPGNSKFFIGSPRISKVTIYLTQLLSDTNKKNKIKKYDKNDDENTYKLQIITYNNSDENIFVEKLYLNGNTITSPFLERNQIEFGAVLEFYMTSDPNECSLC